MTTTLDKPVSLAPCFHLKGGLFTMTSLQMLSYDLRALEAQLKDKIKQAPKFFSNAPIVVDMQRLPQSEETFDFAALLNTFKTLSLIPVGIKGGSTELQDAATKAGLAVLPDTKNPRAASAQSARQLTTDTATTAATKATPAAEETDTNKTPTRLITQPVRSGQQIYARGGDLLVMASVSHGAELLADGHIHVYGPLRGRALAGVSGDAEARIFCLSLEAELISIAGQYRICDDFKDTLWKQSVSIHLADNALKINPLLDR